MELILDCTESPFAEFTGLNSAEQIPWAKEYGMAQNSFLSPSRTIEMRTSGSTGAPKTIELSKGTLCHSALLTAKTFDLRPGTKALLCLPPTGIGGYMMLVRAMVCKWKLVCVAPSLDPLKDVSEDLEFAAMTPVQAQRSIEKYADKWRKIKTVIIGGAVVSAGLEKMLSSSGPDCYITYGMTETAAHVAIRKPHENKFVPLEGVRFTADESGLLTILADHLPEPIQTRDVVALQPDGSFELLGRADNVINSGGVKIQPEPMEQKCAYLFKNRFYITSASDEAFGQLPVVVVEGEMSLSDRETALIALRTMFGAISAPRKILLTPKFEETKTGKIIRWKNILSH